MGKFAKTRMIASTDYTKLRDFGAFQVDISLLDTRELSAIDPSVQSPSTKFGGAGAIIHLPTPLSPSGSGQHIMESWHRPVEIARSAPKKRSIKFAIRAGLTMLLSIILIRSVSWSTLLGILARVDPGILLIAVTVGTVATILSAYQWRSLLHAEGIRLDLARLINLYAVGIAFSHFLPTSVGGDVVKAMYVGRESGNHAGSASAVILSRITGFFGMLLVAFPAMLIWHEAYSSRVVAIFVLLSLLLGGMIGGTVLIVKLLPAIARSKWTNHRLLETQFIAPATRIGNALGKSARRPRSLGVSTLFGMLFHLVVSLNYYAYALALHMTVPLYFYFVAIPLVTLVAFLPISINGFGVRESVFVFVFSTIHVPASTSLLLAFLMDLEVLFFGAVGGCMYLAIGEKKQSGGVPRSRPGRVA